jgi:copper chaperone
MSPTITVEDMSCEHCERTVEEALEAIGGVTAATADHETGSVTIEGSAGTDALVEAVENAGYDASA